MQKPAIDPGTPFLGHEDLAGTAFLLQAEGRIPRGSRPIQQARVAHHRDHLDRARARAQTANPHAWDRMRTARTSKEFQENDDKTPAGDFDVSTSQGVDQSDARDALSFLLSRLTPDEACLIRWKLEGIPHAEIALRFDITVDGVLYRWVNLRNKARELLQGKV